MSANLGNVSDERTARRWTPRPKEPFMLQVRRVDFMYIRDVYAAAMRLHNINKVLLYKVLLFCIVGAK
jgi:hypothetical protein